MRISRLVSLVAIFALFAACSGDGGDATTTTGPPSDQATQAPGGTTDGGASASASITISGFDYTGASSVAVGTTVVVTNEDDVSHTWTSEDDLFDSGSLTQGESFEYTFEDAGEYMFVCSIHPGMDGSITVEG